VAKRVFLKVWRPKKKAGKNSFFEKNTIFMCLIFMHLWIFWRGGRRRNLPFYQSAFFFLSFSFKIPAKIFPKKIASKIFFLKFCHYREMSL